MCEYIGHEINPCGCAELAKAKADFAGAMGSLIVAEAVAKDEAEKRNKALADWAKADQANTDRINRFKNEVEQVKAWLKETRESWLGSDNEFTEYYGELCEMLDVELTEEVEVSVTLIQTIKVRKPIGIDIDESDFYTRSYAEIRSNSDEVEVLDHIDDASVNEVDVR